VKIVVDTYAWIELFIGSRKGQAVKEKLGSAEEVYTPDAVLAELARKYIREGLESNVVEERPFKASEVSRIVPIDKSIAIRVAELDHELKEKAKKASLREPSLIDAMILATTRTLNANLITGDQQFKGGPETIWIGDG